MKIKNMYLSHDVASDTFRLRLQYEDGKDYTMSGEVIGDIVYLAWKMDINPYGLRDLLKEME